MKGDKSKTINRKDFFKKTCLASACFCGFTPIADYGASIKQTSANDEAGNKNLKFMQNWISNLLLNIDENSTQEDCRKIIKPCAMAHYSFLGMGKFLAPYVGDIEKFSRFLSEEWGWKIDYNPDSEILTADENKSYCVCPLVNKDKGVKFSALCYCSEGLAEKMFSEVIGYPVTARVISSIHRGNKHCIYEVRLKKL